MIEGLTQAADDFPSPPVSAAELKAKLERCNAAATAAVAAETVFKDEHVVKDDALEDLVDGLKADLRYAEVAVRAEPVILPRKSGHHVGPVAVYGREVVHGEGATAPMGSRFVVKRWLRCRLDSEPFGV